MTGITTGTGLISGINISDLVSQLMTIQRRPAALMENQVKTIQGRQAALQTVEATLLTLQTSAKQLNTDATYKTYAVDNSDTNQLSVTAGTTAAPGDYQFRTVQTVRTSEATTQGIANSDTQTFNAGTMVIATGGGLDQQTLLSALNDGNGVRRGTIRITDRSGASANIDLSSAYSVDDVVNAINSTNGISVRARTDGGKLVLDDTSGGTAANLTIADVNGGHAAQDLGIRGSVAAGTLAGSNVYTISKNFALSEINDGNQMYLSTGNDLQVTARDGTVLDVDLDGSKTVDDVLKKINGATGNGGKVVASLSDGKLVLNDTTGGSGTLSVANLNGASVVNELGLNRAASGNTLTGRALTGGINTVLLDNLRGGQGISQLGQLTLTDRAGNTATVDLSNADSLDDVMNAINTATTSGGDKLGLSASLNGQGTGIQITDTTGGSGNLVIADAGGGTIAADLGITTNSATDSVSSGNLNLRYVNAATSLTAYAAGGKPVGTGAFRITDSNGASQVFTLSTTATSLGDVLKAINSASGIQVNAKLNDTGDGFSIVDEAGGSGTLKIESVSGTVAKDLRLLGTATTNSQGQQEVDSRRAAVIQVAATDTLTNIVNKINASGEKVSASIVSSGSPVNPLRMIIRSGTAGAAGQLFVDEGGVGLGITNRVKGQDAVLQVGGDPQSAFYVSSNTNTFANVIGNLTVNVKSASATAADVNITRDDTAITNAMTSLVNNYNTWLSAYQTVTKFDTTTNTAAALQGNSFLLNVQTRMETILNTRYGATTSPIRTLADLGVSVGQDGKLSLDTDKLNQQLDTNPQALTDFFRTAKTGFADTLTTTLTNYTDQFTGTFKNENDSMQNDIDRLNDRINTIDDVLAIRQDTLTTQFQNMEATLANLQAGQQQIATIQPIK